MKRPLILVTNDDGITSSGLWAAVEAVLPLGDILVVAPNRQWSGAGRAMPHDVTGRLEKINKEIKGRTVTAYAVDASPALAVGHGVLELAPRCPALVVSGVNFGANLSVEVTISGTVGAALEASAFGIPALAISLEMDPDYYMTGKETTDYASSIAYTQRFARLMLRHGVPFGVDVLNINIPSDATPSTSWRYTRLSRYRYFDPLPPDRENGQGRPGYQLIQNPHQTELDSDLRALLVERKISVTPLSLDITAPVMLHSLNESLNAELSAYQDEATISTHTSFEVLLSPVS